MNAPEPLSNAVSAASASAVTAAAAAGLSAMLGVGHAHRHHWSPAELRAMLRHQLDAPLQLSLGALSAEVAHLLNATKPPLDPLMTLGQLLRLPAPPLGLLKLVKSFAKGCRNDPDNPLPTGLVMMLYYVSVTKALVTHQRRISSVGTPALLQGLGWLAAQEWVDADARRLLEEGMTALGTQASPQ
jgi:hypothetical protein